ncbi:glycosyltransferase family 25 protein [Vibrio coralliilyticus]|uniref:glycosyltransferase family 25 protein n=1 Tax=Vibrio coralliilyticus TaxID=190893 RepID=UPI001813BDE4|nr:glycosyltransferase family 25 protein [Vibrio coralliilyticus]NUW68994.1 glycosyltransferase family 25 protein [Vibrio coralliilyticus]
MKIFVINLPRSVDRRISMEAQLKKLGVANYEFFEAIDGSQMPSYLADKVDDEHRKKFRSRPLSYGERGIYASNYLLWEKCVQQNEPFLIMEDDVVLEDCFVSICNRVEKLHSKGFEYFRLGISDTSEVPQVIDVNENIVHWCDNQSGSTRCYSISPRGAAKLLKRSEKWICAVDNYIGEAYRTKIPCLGIIPYASSKAEYESTIQLGEKSKVSLINKLIRELYRFYRFLRMSVWNRILFAKALPNKGQS